MNLLGIETSCDETACAVVKNGKKILFQIILSSIKSHTPFKGIVPEIASRSHLDNMNLMIGKVLNKVGKDKIDALAVTVGPGLIGSLLIGKTTAETMGWVWDIPVVGVNHLEAHLFSPALTDSSLKPPFIGLIVSGGHTDLVLVKDYGEYHVLGRTRDDSAGEAFDKIASLLHLGYPGGPKIDRLSRFGRAHSIPFPRAYIKDSWDFSFSGLKTSVLYYLKKLENEPNSQKINDICASFQSAIVEVLIYKAILAAKKYNIRKISVGGGVSANSELRKQFLSEGHKSGIKIFFTAHDLCTDNAAMIAGLGYHKIKRCGLKENSLDVNPSLPILNWN